VASKRLLRDQEAILSVIDAHQRDGRALMYLLEQGDSYKIGFSSCVSRRVRTFNTAHQKPIRVLVVAPGGREREAELHKQFAPYRVAREWFRKSNMILRTCMALPGAMSFIEGHITADAPQTHTARA
jgi:hypothetical protein